MTQEESAVAPVIVQIVPTAPGGVRDFAECLKREWHRHGVASSLMARSRAEARAAPLHERLASLRGSDTAPLSVVLHFSGYGYDARALCHWLLVELREARRVMGPALHLVTVVHELYASGPPWGSAFWIGGLQASITRSIARLSDGVWTNTSHHGRWLQEAVGHSSAVQVRPVFSNVGEPDTVPPLAQRCQGLVVFGSASTRRRALAKLPACIDELRSLGVDGVTEVGDGPSGAATPAGLSHSHLGRLNVDTLGDVLQRHRFALIDYPSLHFGKSGVFAAYVSHGCLVLNTAGVGTDAEGLQRGHHYLALGDREAAAVDAPEQGAIARAAREWYQGHPCARQAAEFLEWLGMHSPAASVVRTSRGEAPCAWA